MVPGTALTTLHGSQGPVHALCYSASPGTYILSGSADRNIRLYNPFPNRAEGSGGVVQPGKLIQTYGAHGYEVLDIAVSADNARFVSGGGDRSVFLWDVATAKTIRRFGGNHGHSSRVNSVCFGGAEDSVVISGSFDASVRLWDSKSQSMKPIQTLGEARDSISAVLVGGRGHEIVSGSVDGRVRCYDVRMGQLSVDVLGSPVTSLAVTRDGQGLLVGTLDSTIRLMDRNSGGRLMTYKGHENAEFRIRSCFGGKEGWVLSGSEVPRSTAAAAADADGEVLIWDTMTGTIMKRVRVPGRADDGARKKVIGADGKEKARRNVISCVAWKNDGRGDQWSCAGTDGLVTVFGTA
ncbi:MAG: hypothetical protein M1818_008282 [Claussenomyces sp. TS43310]|nr:MAG: hypothetical protein M1818_008282 [Claussenomyces sp. TS43310]